MNKLTQKLTVLLFCGISATAVRAADEFKFNADAAMPDNVSTCSDAINYQGYLVDPATAKEYVNGIYKFDVRLYKSEDDATPIWGAQYEAYVKGGYFNLMLGDGGKELDIGKKPTTYKQPSDLWKAMWLTTAKDNQKLYLGLTVRQDKDHNLIDTSKLKEISPRQRLLSSPYAFRAERATYADRATQNFEVPGDLKVKGGFSLAGGGALSFGQFSSDSTGAKVGTDKNTPSQTTVQGGTVIVNSSGSQNFNPGGDVTFQMDAGKTFNVKDGSLKVEGERMEVRASSDVSMFGNQVNLVALNGGQITGNGYLRWSTPESGNNIQDCLFRLVHVVMTIPANQYGATAKIFENSPLTAKRYVWHPMNLTVTGGADNECAIVQASVSNLQQVDGGMPELGVLAAKKQSSARTVTVTCLGLLRGCVGQ